MAERKPPVYTPALADVICERLAAGESLNRICKDDGMPAESTVRLWAKEDRDGFAAKYARAREEQWQHWAEEILDIADDSSNDYMLTEKGMAFNGENVKRSALRVEARKWTLSKMLPRVYGDRMALTGGDGGPILHKDASLDDMTADELAALAISLAKNADA